MTNILNQVAKSFRSQFKPASPDEYFALRLAYLLGEPEAAAHYATLSSQYPQTKLLCAYRRATSGDRGAVRPSRIFHDYLSKVGIAGSDEATHSKLLAVRIERRALAVAVFAGLHLEGRRVLHLSSDSSRAEASTAGFIHAVLSENECPSAAVELVTGDVRRARLHGAVMKCCRESGVSVWEISGKSVVAALAHPPPRSRSELRELMLRMWPVQGLKQSEMCALDAFALGLYVQTDRLFAADH